MANNSILAVPKIQKLVMRHLNAQERKEAVLICRSFYETICLLEWNKTLKLGDKIMNNDIYESMMLSNRRFKGIQIKFQEEEKIKAERVASIVAKYKNHAKVLTEAISDMEEISWLTEFEIGSSAQNSGNAQRSFVLQKKFSKLKRLTIVSISEITGLLSRVPDDSLEEFSHTSFNSSKINRESLQAFLNRQKSLKKLIVSWINGKINLEHHLALEEFSLYTNNDHHIAGILKKQAGLGRLECGVIGKLAFKELLKMPNLEVLKCSFNMCIHARGELESLTKLEFRGEWSELSQLVLPNLKELTVREDREESKSEFFDHHYQSLTAESLERVEICRDIRFMPAIIEHFPTLKALVVRSTSDECVDWDKEDVSLQDPSEQNLSLEELIIEPYRNVSMAPVYDTIEACPNLKRIHLRNVALTGHQILVLIRKLKDLTHFVFISPSEDVFGKKDSCNQVLRRIINIFKKSPDFVYLDFSNIWPENVKRFLDNDQDFDKEDFIVVESKRYYGSGSDIKIAKSSDVTDFFTTPDRYDWL